MGGEIARRSMAGCDGVVGEGVGGGRLHALHCTRLSYSHVSDFLISISPYYIYPLYTCPICPIHALYMPTSAYRIRIRMQSVYRNSTIPYHPYPSLPNLGKVDRLVTTYAGDLL